MASIVKAGGRVAASMVEREMGWNRNTIRKGLSELDSGIVCASAASLRGRKPLENSLPDLEADLREMGEGASQTDPTFRATQLYRRLTAGEARRRLIEEKGYDLQTAPSERSLRRKLSSRHDLPRCASRHITGGFRLSQRRPPDKKRDDSLRRLHGSAQGAWQMVLGNPPGQGERASRRTRIEFLNGLLICDRVP